MGKEIIIGTYGLMMIAGISAGTALALVVARKRGYNPSQFINYCTLIIASIIGGALLAGFILFLPERAGKEFIDYPPVLVSWGGILGGCAGIIYITIAWEEEFLTIADCITPGYCIGLGIGRIGCFFAGCCYGTHTASCIGVTFTDPLAPASAMAQPLVPVQMISAAVLICIGLVLLPVSLTSTMKGLAFSISAMAYSIFRFTIEFWRDDPRVFLLGLSDGQVFSIFYFLIGLIIILYSVRVGFGPGPDRI